MNVAVIGAGYVGLVSGVCLASVGHNVTCVDVDEKVVARLNAGRPHIYERGLHDLLKQVVRARRFSVTTDIVAALEHADLVLICVGTPSPNGAIDLRYVLDVARSIGAYIATSDRYLSIVVKSTVLPGTTDTSVRAAIETASGKTLGAFGLGMNPEFLREGEAITDFMEPDRIVLGYEDERTLSLLEELYGHWQVDKVRVNTRTAELIKYANNALLATQISAINELANLAGALGGIDFMDVVAGVHLDKRWNPVVAGVRVSPGILTYLVPGCGFGGSCFPKDVQALRAQGERLGLPMHMLKAIIDVNDAQPGQVVEILEREGICLSGMSVALLGLAFKPGTDDVRESASLKVARNLLERGARVSAYDPVAGETFKAALGAGTGDIEFVADWKTSVSTADIVIVATAWPEFEELAYLDLTGKIFFDARRMFNPSAVESDKYVAIGVRGASRGRPVVASARS